MPSWLRETEFGKILMNSNSHYKFDIPLNYLDVSSRNVTLEYIIGGVFYIIKYTVGEGEPYADFDFEIPGVRGGTHRTRYYGHLEGVDNETLKLAKGMFALCLWDSTEETITLARDRMGEKPLYYGYVNDIDYDKNDKNVTAVIGDSFIESFMVPNDKTIFGRLNYNDNIVVKS